MKRPLLLVLLIGFVVLCAAPEVSFAQEVDEYGNLIEKPPEPEDPLKNLKTIASYALTALGALYIGYAVMQTFTTSMSYPKTKMMLINFIRTNPYQLVALGKKVQGTLTEPIIAALKIGGQMGPIELKMIQSATLPTYEATAKGMLTKFATTMTMAKLAATAALAGAIVAFTGGRWIPVVLGALAGLGFLRLYLHKQDLESQILRGKAEILPEVDAAVASGRYHTPIVPPQ